MVFSCASARGPQKRNGAMNCFASKNVKVCERWGLGLNGSGLKGHLGRQLSGVSGWPPVTCSIIDWLAGLPPTQWVPSNHVLFCSSLARAQGNATIKLLTVDLRPIADHACLVPPPHSKHDPGMSVCFWGVFQCFRTGAMGCFINRPLDNQCLFGKTSKTQGPDSDPWCGLGSESGPCVLLVLRTDIAGSQTN